MNQNENQKNGNSKHLPIGVGIGLLLIVISLTFFIKHLTGEQFLFLRMILPIALAAIAVIIPGYIEIAYKGLVRIFGPIAIFAVTYFYNPVGIEPFEYTIQIQKNSSKISNSYPSNENDEIEILLDNEWKSSKITKNEDVDFKNIPYNFKGKDIKVRLQSNYWKLVKDTLQLVNKSNALQIEPNGTLSIVKGITFDNKGKPIPNVEIQLLGQKYKSDKNGVFNIPISPEFLKIEHEAIFFLKNGSTKKYILKASISDDNEISL